MELFSTTGFEIGDKVFTLLDDKKYFGVVVKIDDRLGRIKVDYSAKGETAIDWFRKHFWQKVE
jgi:hypothetical protein